MNEKLEVHLERLAEFSRKYGKNNEFVLAGGGNTSYKTNTMIYVKSSGCSLASITKEQFAALHREKLAKLMNKKYPTKDAEREAAFVADLNGACANTNNLRPSVEALLHDLLPQNCVAHFHPTLINVLTCAKNGRKIAEEIFGAENFLWIPAVKPGLSLAQKCEELLSKYKYKNNRGFVLLENHGAFWSADSFERLEEFVDETVKNLEEFIKSNLKNSIEINNNSCDSVSVEEREKLSEIMPILRGIYARKLNCETASAKFICKSKNKVLTNLTPDHIVYCKAEPLLLSGCNNLNETENNIKTILNEFDKFEKSNGYLPKIVSVENLGIIALGKTRKECLAAEDLFLDGAKIVEYVENMNILGGISPLNKNLCNFITGWEVENYRSNISLNISNNSENISNRLDGKIAVITGAAQGFGAGIAENMLKNGACVIIADLNYTKACEFCEELNANFSGFRATAVKVDVSDEESVKAMIEWSVLEYGGIDIFINNAGIVKAGSLEELNLKDFNLVASVNYAAYFLCVKYASRIMKLQHKANPAVFADIIEINSKSGLAGSNKNFAYSGSKFGGIGLTQSFALELAEFNIKVNAICPGNFLDGPLWSDPERGLFVQYLQAGKVAGAKTVEDVRKFYESKVPMNRGCEVIDVFRAVLYAIEQKYETGQAIPVTGGQEMLK